MSLLLSAGHVDAPRYTLAKVWSEARIVRQRNAARMKMEVLLLQQAVASNFSKKAGKQFNTTLTDLDEHD